MFDAPTASVRAIASSAAGAQIPGGPRCAAALFAGAECPQPQSSAASAIAAAGAAARRRLERRCAVWNPAPIVSSRRSSHR